MSGVDTEALRREERGCYVWKELFDMDFYFVVGNTPPKSEVEPRILNTHNFPRLPTSELPTYNYV